MSYLKTDDILSRFYNVVLNIIAFVDGNLEVVVLLRGKPYSVIPTNSLLNKHFVIEVGQKSLAVNYPKLP